MATQSNRPPREVVEFPPNIPVTVALKYGQGKTVSNQYGERMMFSLVDGRVLFLDLDVAGQIAQLGINVRENFTITKQSDGRKDSPITWAVARLAGEQPNGTLVVPALPVPPAVPAKLPVPAAAIAEPVAIRPPGRGLVDEANALVDSYAEVLARALTKYEGRIKPEEARALLITAYIQRSKLSSVA
jgi:hypothetical protein